MKNEDLVMIVDDSRSNIQTLSAVLKQGGYRSIAALDGVKAVEMAERQQPELILLDINMPGMSGYEVATLLKSEDVTKHIPIIYISALDDLDAKLKAFNTFGVDYITKPFESAEVLARVQTQLELSQLRRASVKHAQEMEHFAFMAAHDLKAPANVIESYCNLLLSGKGSLNEQTLGQMKKASHGLRSLVDGLLDLAEASKPRCEFENIEAKVFLEKIVRKIQLEVQPVLLEVHIEGDQKVRGGRTHLESLFTNILTNAVKYRRREEGVTVNIGIENHQVTKTSFTFQDDGIGFDETQAQKLFVPFQRLENAHSTGHGLGLCICKKIAELHGGSITACGIPNEGATFRVIL
jgi:two-component system, sensor histidine kinase and response regulator